MFTRINRGQSLQKLTGHAGWLKFRYADSKRGKWLSNIENDTASV